MGYLKYLKASIGSPLSLQWLMPPGRTHGNGKHLAPTFPLRLPAQTLQIDLFLFLARIAPGTPPFAAGDFLVNGLRTHKRDVPLRSCAPSGKEDTK